MGTPAGTERLEASAAGLARAGELLRGGGLVAMPTETVYGLAAVARNAAAVERIFVAKGRPHWDPLIVHVADAGMVGTVARAVADVEQRLMEAFWPGPLTLLLPRRPELPPVVTAGRELVGVRMPRHPVAVGMIRAAGAALAAPSANRFGHVSPTCADHVLADLDGRIDAIVDAGACGIGVESTVAECSAERDCAVPGGWCERRRPGAGCRPAGAGVRADCGGAAREPAVAGRGHTALCDAGAGGAAGGRGGACRVGE